MQTPFLFLSAVGKQMGRGCGVSCACRVPRAAQRATKDRAAPTSRAWFLLCMQMETGIIKSAMRLSCLIPPLQTDPSCSAPLKRFLLICHRHRTEAETSSYQNLVFTSLPVTYMSTGFYISLFSFQASRKEARRSVMFTGCFTVTANPLYKSLSPRAAALSQPHDGQVAS